MKPDKSDEQAAELAEAKSEILNLQAQMRRIEEERDILKKPLVTLSESLSIVPIHQPPPTPTQHNDDVSRASGGSERLYQGTQYSSDDWLRFCLAHNLDPIMSPRGNCRDDAVAGSFLSSLKKERIRKGIYKTRDQAKGDVFDYIEVFYNRVRRQDYLLS